jgi:hypothetical protein
MQFDFRKAEGLKGNVGEGRIDGEAGRQNENEFQLFDGGLTSAKDGPVIQFSPRQMINMGDSEAISVSFPY